MSSLEQQFLPGILSPISPAATAIDAGDGGGGAAFSSLDSSSPMWLSGCHGAWYTLALVLPSAVFVLFLASKARRSLTRLSYGRSYIMIAYYALLWLVTVLNLVWCLLQAWQCTPGKESAWNFLSLLTTSGVLFLEISLVAFLLQGNQTSGFEALTRTFISSGIIVAADMMLKAVSIFGFGVPLFLDDSKARHQLKWGLLIVHNLFLVAIYGSIMLMYNTKARERLPARPAFYKYIFIMLVLNVATLFACVLVACGARLGFWLYKLTIICYQSLYLPFLYMIFLADFFQEEDINLENMYYSEMKDAGFFDGDWD